MTSIFTTVALRVSSSYPKNNPRKEFLYKWLVEMKVVIYWRKDERVETHELRCILREPCFIWHMRTMQYARNHSSFSARAWRSGSFAKLSIVIISVIIIVHYLSSHYWWLLREGGKGIEKTDMSRGSDILQLMAMIQRAVHTVWATCTVYSRELKKEEISGLEA